MLFYFKYCNRELLLCFQLTNTNTLQMCTFDVFVCMLLCVCVWISVCSFLHYPILCLCLCYLLFLSRFVFIMFIHSYLFLTVVRKIIFEFNYRCSLAGCWHRSSWATLKFEFFLAQRKTLCQNIISTTEQHTSIQNTVLTCWFVFISFAFIYYCNENEFFSYDSMDVHQMCLICMLYSFLKYDL